MMPLILMALSGGTYLNRSIDGTTFNFSNFAADPEESASGVRIATDGDVDERDQNTHSDRGDWLNTGGTASDYEVKFDYVSGSADGGDSTGSFLALTQNRETFIEQTSFTGSANTAQVTVTIRHATNTDDSISFTANLSAEKTLP